MSERKKRRRPSTSKAEEVGSDDESAAPSGHKARSDSMYEPMNFRVKSPQSGQTGKSPGPGAVSIKSDASMLRPINLREEDKQSQLSGEPSSCSVCTEPLKDSAMMPCGHWSCTQCLNLGCKMCGKKRRYQLRRPKELINIKASLSQQVKTAMRSKFALVSEGNGDPKSPLKNIYTELLITTKKNEGLHEEHVFRHIQLKLKAGSPQKEVDINKIFEPLPDQKNHIRTVLTKGVAGIGKSFSVQKFIRDWAEEEENQDVCFMFCIAFRELNLIRNEKSLLELLEEFHPALKEQTDSVDLMKASTIVILDGLDESHLQLDFKAKPVTSVTEVTSVANLLTNLIKGNLLPDAKIWITSRPAAADQIPAEFVDMVTEIRGFSDPQKEAYFKKRCSHDSGLADRIISHIRSTPSLDIMCQIPIFCWICAVLFKEVFGGDEKAEIPQTLTEMMAHYLFAQTVRKSRKYNENPEEKELLLKNHKEFLLKLGKLAFIKLLDNNLIFYNEDLEQCGIDVKEATIYSGFFSEILREEQVFSQKVFFFVHLTIQEFFAALFVYECFTNQKTEELGNFLDLKDKEHSLLDLLKMTVDKVLEKKNGHLDFFMRFLLGLMVEPNRRLLKSLLTSPDQETEKKILTHLKAIRRKNLPPDSSIILFQAMVEMRDHKIKDEIQEFLRSPERMKTELTPLHCSALAYMLQVSKEDLEVLDLKSFNTTDEGRRRLTPAVRVSKKAVLADCKVTEDWIEHLAFGLAFPYSPLRDLDLSNNDLQDSGVTQLCEGLSSPLCRLETLRLSGCMVTEKGCAYLASALKSNPSHLTELDLSYNHLGDSGKKLLSELETDSEYKLCKVSVDHSGKERMKPGFRKYACELTFDPKTVQENLTFSEGNRKVAWVEEEQQYPGDEERSGHRQQVLCEQALSERYYIEVEMLRNFRIGLKYKTVEKKGDMDDCELGQDDRSWCLTCSNDGCFVSNEGEKISVASLRSRSSRVAVYLDCPAGTLSFYKVSSDSRTRLHTFKTKFSEPLYLAVELHVGSSATLCVLT